MATAGGYQSWRSQGKRSLKLAVLRATHVCATGWWATRFAPARPWQSLCPLQYTVACPDSCNASLPYAGMGERVAIAGDSRGTAADAVVRRVL